MDTCPFRSNMAKTQAPVLEFDAQSSDVGQQWQPRWPSSTTHAATTNWPFWPVTAN
jgi:hypothetical protein